MRMDVYEKLPPGMDKYLSHYQWHFSKKMCEFAVSRMYKTKDGKKQKIEPYTKEQTDQLLKTYGIELKNDYAYDACFAANMCKSDYLGSSVQDEQHVALFVEDYLDDPDGYKGLPFTRYYADTEALGLPIIWEDMM